jgi:hypothetical protein
MLKTITTLKLEMQQINFYAFLWCEENVKFFVKETEDTIVNTASENAKTLITFIVYIFQELSSNQRHYFPKAIVLCSIKSMLSYLRSKIPCCFTS